METGLKPGTRGRQNDQLIYPQLLYHPHPFFIRGQVEPIAFRPESLRMGRYGDQNRRRPQLPGASHHGSKKDLMSTVDAIKMSERYHRLNARDEGWNVLKYLHTLPVFFLIKLVNTLMIIWI